MKKSIIFAAVVIAFASCSKKENGKCYSCTKTVSHCLKTRVGNETNGTTTKTVFEKCFTDHQELTAYEGSQFIFETVGDSIFTQSVGCK